MTTPTVELSLPRAAVLIGAGVVSAAHVGKAVIALPQLSADLGLDLPGAGALLASFMVLGVFSGALVGRAIDRFGGVRSVVVGLAVSGTTSLLAPAFTSALALGALRAVEGLGFLVVATAVPGVLARGLRGPRRRFVLGFWGLYMPVGQASAVLVGPHVMRLGGWQALWTALGLSSLVFLALVWWAVRPSPVPPAVRRAGTASRPHHALFAPGVLLAAVFGFYSLQYAAVSGFLPVALGQLHRVPTTDAGWLTALVMLCNAVGNIVGGVLQHRSVPGPWALGIGTLGMLASALGVFLLELSLPLTVALFAGFALFGGLVPSTILSLVPRVASLDGLGRLNGLINQAVQFGSLIGPPLVGLGVAVSQGWPGALWVLVPANLAAVAVAVGLGRALRGPGHDLERA